MKARQLITILLVTISVFESARWVESRLETETITTQSK